MITRHLLPLLLAAISVPASVALALEIDETEDEIRIMDGEGIVLVYHKTELAPPEGSSRKHRWAGCRRSSWRYPGWSQSRGAACSLTSTCE